jgi:putative inorganic carbon (hco3(-)) transporter
MATILLILIFIRPFIASLAFPELNSIYSLSLLLFLAIWAIIRRLPFKRSLPLKFAPTAFCLALAISIFAAKNRLTSANELYKYATGLLLFITAASFNNKEKINTIKTIVWAGLVISLLAISQYLSEVKFTLDYLNEYKAAGPFFLHLISQKRVFSPFVTPNILAGFLLMVIPLALTIKKRIFFLLPMLLAFFLTESLGALLGLFLVLGLYYYLRGKTYTKKAVFFTGVTIAAVIVIILLIRSHASAGHHRPLFSLTRRWDYWIQTLEMIMKFPLTGVGLGNFDLRLTHYAHNSYLEIWAEMGILWLIGFLWIVIASFAECLNKLRLDPSASRNLTNVGLLVSSAAFLIDNLINFTFFLPEVALIWWVILGLMLSRDS